MMMKWNSMRVTFCRARTATAPPHMSSARARAIDALVDNIAHARDHALALMDAVRALGGDADAHDGAERIKRLMRDGEKLAAQRDALRADAFDARVTRMLDDIDAMEEGETTSVGARGKVGGKRGAGQARADALDDVVSAYDDASVLTVTCVRLSDDAPLDVVVTARAPGVFEARWNVQDSGSVNVSATHGESTVAHDAFTDRAKEYASVIKANGRDEVDITRELLAWFAERSDVFTAPDALNGGRVLAADATRSNALIPSRLLPGR